MYPPFFQFTLPKMGQAALAALLYLLFLHQPLLQPLAPRWPLIYLGVPLLLAILLSYFSRDPLGPGMVLVGHLALVYCLGLPLELAARALGGGWLRAWQVLWLGGLLPWLLTALLWWFARRRALTLCVTTYRLTTDKPLPGGRLRVVQLSDLHPRPGAAMHSGRIPELRRKLTALQPDLLALTGDLFDEYTPRSEFDAFCTFFAGTEAPLGKYFVVGNHDFEHYWRQQSDFTRADADAAFATAQVVTLDDRAVITGGVRVVGRQDFLLHPDRAGVQALLPGGPDDVYTVWLDHEPRQLREAAQAGADLILCGHTHAGQIWPGGIFGRLMGNELNYGLKRVDGAAAIVSGGTGTWAAPLRTAGRTEIVCVDITNA